MCSDRIASYPHYKSTPRQQLTHARLDPWVPQSPISLLSFYTDGREPGAGIAIVLLVPACCCAACACCCCIISFIIASRSTSKIKGITITRKVEEANQPKVPIFFHPQATVGPKVNVNCENTEVVTSSESFSSSDSDSDSVSESCSTSSSLFVDGDDRYPPIQSRDGVGFVVVCLIGR